MLVELMILTFKLLTIILSAYAIYVMARRGHKSVLSKTPKMSEVSKRLLKEYNSIPKEHRPDMDITHALEVLDYKFEPDAVERRRHFDRNWLPYTQVQNGSFSFSWTARSKCTHRYCKFHEYADIHTQIMELLESIRERKRVERSSGFDKESVEELMRSLRNETEMNRAGTKALKSLDM